MIELKSITNNKTFVVVGLIAGVLAVGGLAYQLSQDSSSKPSYYTILPASKSIDELGGWQRVSPPEKDPVFAYIDQIDGTPVTVSQQPLPKSFKPDTEQHVEQLAEKFNASSKLEASDNTSVYVGTSAKGPQSAILTKNGVLIMIKSQKEIEPISWINYVNSLSSYRG